MNNAKSVYNYYIHNLYEGNSNFSATEYKFAADMVKFGITPDSCIECVFNYFGPCSLGLKVWSKQLPPCESWHFTKYLLGRL